MIPRKKIKRSELHRMVWVLRARRIADRVDPLTPNPPSPLDYPDADLRPLYGWETIE
jgi:hypothetical protein